MSLPKELNQQIVELLLTVSNMHDQNGRRAFIQSASLDSQLQQQIIYSGPPGQFVQLLVSTLNNYGTLANDQDALEAVLEVAKERVGGNKQVLYTAAIEDLRAFRKGQYIPPKAGSRQRSSSVGSLSQEKRAALDAQLVDLYRKYRAANAQLTATLIEVDKITIKNQVTQIEQEIQAIETELNSL